MKIDIVTIFPEIFEGPLSASMVGIARDRGTLEVETHDLRTWTHDRHRQVDDSPYGGGPGMVMKPEPFFEAVDDLSGRSSGSARVLLMTPQGRTFNQSLAEELAGESHLLVLCGRYEGYDERIRSLADDEISIGDYVLTGGELPALVVVDAVARLLPEVLGHDQSVVEESFSWGLLEYPHYTRPATYRGMSVPPVLTSGDHAAVARWRRAMALARTARLRPDLLHRADLTDEDRSLLDEGIDES